MARRPNAALLNHYDVVEMVVRRTSATSYLEVGVQEGLTLTAALKPGTIHQLVLCDDWGPHHGGTNRGNHRHIEDLLLNSAYQGSVQWLDGRSQELLPDFRPDQPLDVVHIDGDHSYEGCLSDLLNGWRVTRHAMIVHDISFAEVERAVSEFLAVAPNGQGRLELYEEGHGTLVLTRE